MNFSPGQHRAIITGASSGIGKATAIAFAQAGINLALVSRSLDKLEEVATQTRTSGVDVKTYSLDLGEIQEVKTKISQIVGECPDLDILVNNAGMAYLSLLGETPLEAWQKTLNLNLTSVLQCIQAVLPQMRAQKRGTIINIASIAANRAFPNWGSYCISKAGLLMLSQVLAEEERGNGIRVTTILPGAVNTPIWESEGVNLDWDRSGMLNPETVAQAILHTVLLPPGAVIETLLIAPSAGAIN